MRTLSSLLILFSLIVLSGYTPKPIDWCLDIGPTNYLEGEWNQINGDYVFCIAPYNGSYMRHSQWDTDAITSGDVYFDMSVNSPVIIDAHWRPTTNHPWYTFEILVKCDGQEIHIWDTMPGSNGGQQLKIFKKIQV